jgi:carbonic anhydrase/acetyltransferase-like protein (isoleucine patch superfamily)
VIRDFQALHPMLGKGVRVAENATVVGNVMLEECASVWYSAVLRSDKESVRVGRNSNLQDGVLVHIAPHCPVSIGANVTVGHGAIVHGCTVGDGVLIGMGAILLNGCVVGEGSIVAAGSVVTERTVIPPRSLVIGTPARVVRSLREEELAGNLASAEEYVSLSAQQLPLAGAPL